ncbi:MAG: hypothetical protein DHS20C13_15070 [Thermodesulfobacteriota bacterium]|nr:MAG: hypothetical protein DHS20C13_15070 [Thermodesulfobacteriota bacterium]
MCINTIKLIREEGKKLYQSLNEELYLNHAGLKNKTALTQTLKSFRDLLEPEVFQSLLDAKPNTEEKSNGIKLIRAFLAETILISKSPQIEDSILDIEASSIFAVGKSKISFRKSKSALLTKSKKEETENIENKRESVLAKLNQLYLRQYAYRQKDSHDLGYRSYLNLYELLENHNSVDLAEKAKELIRDTEYISRDLLSWFMSKRMDIKLNNAGYKEMFYLLNSFELTEAFAKLNPHSLAKAILKETGILLPAEIKFDTQIRKGHISGSISHLSNPGVEMLISTNLQGGILDYESFLESFGESLCYGFTDRDDHFEYAYLRERSFVMTFSILLKNLIFEPTWLKKHFRFDAESDFLKLIYLRRLIQLRILCAKVIFEVALYQRQDDKSEMYREIMEIATHCKPNKYEYLYDIQPHLSSLDSFKANMSETKLRAFLLENYDEQWWREQEANDFLCKIWETGGRMSVSNLSDKCGFGNYSSNNLLQTFEEVLG